MKALSARGIGGKLLASNLGRKTVAYTAGLSTDLFVEGTNSLSSEGHNLTGQLKEMFPNTFNFIPYSIATHPTDGADVKRNKAVLEAAGWYNLAGALSGFVQILRAGQDLKKLGKKIIPKTEESKQYFKRKFGNNFVSDGLPSVNPITDAAETASLRNEESIEELARLTLITGEELDKPIRGIHDVFDPLEMTVRTADEDGLSGAMLRQVQINKNIGTANGRIGNFFSEAALKFGVNADNLSKRTLVNSIVDEIRQIGKFDAVVNNIRIKDADIDAAGTRLAEIFIDPRSDPGVIKGVLNGLKDQLNSGLPRLSSIGYDGAVKTIKRYLNAYFDMDVAKAQAYIATSTAGDVSDIAEGMRISKGTDSVKFARNMIKDRLRYLMVEKALASYTYGEGLRTLNVWERIAKLRPENAEQAAKLIEAKHQYTLGQIIPEVDDTLTKFESMVEDNPEFFEPLYMAYEWSDGKIDTIHKLNELVQNKLGTWEKAVLDNNPKMPSMIMQSVWSNIYNSALSAFATPLKAGLGNLGGVISDPITMFAGALLEGDIKTVRRGLSAYGGVVDSFQKANQHLGFVYRKATTDPNSVGYIMREDLVMKNEEAFDIIRSYADAASSKGHDGASYLLNMYEVNEDIAQMPWLRFGANSMTALDGWTRSMQASGIAKFRALDRLTASGKPINKSTLKEAADQVYNDMHDASGMLMDPAVDYASREIALNLDGPLVQALNNLLGRVPGLKPGMMFPRTATQMVNTFHKWSWTSMIAGDYSNIALPKLSTFKRNPELVAEILTSKGIPVDEFAWNRFRELRAKVKGRVAIGSSFVMGGSLLYTQSRLRGNGHHDKATMKTRYAANWKPRTYKGWDGNWYSYDNMGPLSDMLALTADIMDNFDLITSPIQEEWLSKVMFVIAANLTNKSVLGQLEPFNDILAGNPAAANRWAASFANITMPLGSQRAELARLMAPAIREMDQDFTQLLANRNPVARNTLSAASNWITGDKIGEPDNFIVRLWNTYAPTFKAHGKSPSPEEQFLIDLEYNGRPGFRSDCRGNEYTAKERAELQSLIGNEENGLREDIRNIMRRAEVDGIIAKLRTIRRSGYTSEQINKKDFTNIIRLLDSAVSRAVQRNETLLSIYEQV